MAALEQDGGSVPRIGREPLQQASERASRPGAHCIRSEFHGASGRARRDAVVWIAARACARPCALDQARPPAAAHAPGTPQRCPAGPVRGGCTLRRHAAVSAIATVSLPPPAPDPQRRVRRGSLLRPKAGSGHAGRPRRSRGPAPARAARARQPVAASPRREHTRPAGVRPLNGGSWLPAMSTNSPRRTACGPARSTTSRSCTRVHDPVPARWCSPGGLLGRTSTGRQAQAWA